MIRNVLCFDVGTTGLKTSLFEIDSELTLIASSSSEYDLDIGPNGEAEQDPEQWWNAMKITIGEILEIHPLGLDKIHGISFCSQMQGLILCDIKGRALRPSMSYMDKRAEKTKERFMKKGPRILSLRVDILIRGLRINGAVPASTKDPIWKYLWVKENEPNIFSHTAYWLDVKEYLIMRLTGRPIMTRDSAFATFLYNTRPGKECWDNNLIRKYHVNPDHLPPVVDSTLVVGPVSENAGRELGLSTKTEVFASGGDASLIALGSGSSKLGDTHVYTGTSGWVSTFIKKRKIDIFAMIASVPSAKKGYFNYFAEQETAGKCLEWVRDHLALDEINIYLDDRTIIDNPESIHENLYELLVEEISKVPAGSRGVIFTPWLHGNRSPFEDPHARGIFFNLSLETGKRAMIRSVIEGIMFNQRWLLESIEKKVKTEAIVRFVGGGALNRYMGQMLSDILQRSIEVPENPQFCGAQGAALVAAVGLNIWPDFDVAVKHIKISQRFDPNPELAPIYDRNYRVFTSLYKSNRKLFHQLNSSV